MGLRELRLGPGECSDVETGARVFAAVAFPAIAEELARSKAEATMVSLWRDDQNRSYARSIDPATRKPRKGGRSWGTAALRTLTRRLGDRMTAARLVRPLILEWVGHPQALPAGMTKFSPRQMALYLTAGDVLAANNLLKRVVRPSRSVLHLAVAIDTYDVQEGRVDLDAGLHLDDVERFAAIVQQSHRLKAHICSDDRYGVRELDVLNLVWVR